MLRTAFLSPILVFGIEPAAISMRPISLTLTWLTGIPLPVLLLSQAFPVRP